MSSKLIKNPTLLFLANRDFLSQSNGRSSVLRGYLDVLSKLNYKVDLVIFAPITNQDAYKKRFSCIESIDCYPLGLTVMLMGAIRSFVTSTSLNTNIFFSKSTKRYFLQKFDLSAYNYIYLDTVRLHRYINKQSDKVKVILDLDDLYSIRYKNLMNSTASLPLLGAFENRIPKFIRPLAKWFANFALSRESKLLREEELTVAKSADGIFIVSPVEAKQLSSQINKSVYDFPMCINEPAKKWQVNQNNGVFKFVFVGSPKLQQNYQTLEKANELYLAGLLGDSQLYVIGNITDFDTSRFSQQIIFLGFVDDLYDALASYDCYFSPIQSGTGIKTKNVEAAMFGMPILTSSTGCDGTELANFISVVDDWGSFNLEQFIKFDLPKMYSNQDALIDYAKQNFTLDALTIKWINGVKYMEQLKD